MSNRAPAEIFPPGEFLREELEERDWTQAEFAEIVQRDSRTVSEIINGKRNISPEMARRIGAALGTSPELWLNIQSAYQLWKLRDQDTSTVTRLARLRDLAPIAEMMRRNWIPESENIDLLEEYMCRFFGLASLNEDVPFDAAARKSTSYSQATLAEKAWLQRARQMATAVHAKPFSRKKLVDGLPELRACMVNAEDVRRVPQLFAQMGIRVVAIQHLPGTRIDGACTWINGRPVVALSLRFDRIDYFWFTLIHELGHVANEDFKDAIGEFGIDVAMDERSDDISEQEQRANAFATEHLVGTNNLESFMQRVRPLYSKKRIEAFARLHGVHPGIVVGQLHKRNEVPYRNLRRMLVPVRDIFLDSVLADGWGHIVPRLDDD